jgi:hypothetical protein
MATNSETPGLEDLKIKSPHRRFSKEILQVGWAFVHHQGTLMQQVKPLLIFQLKGRNKPVVRNLPKVASRSLLSRVSSSDIPLWL